MDGHSVSTFQTTRTEYDANLPPFFRTQKQLFDFFRQKKKREERECSSRIINLFIYDRLVTGEGRGGEEREEERREEERGSSSAKNIHPCGAFFAHCYPKNQN